jgi:histidinol-phosphate/aromatic aminotransferase/cobyric acid decarboxylase-like protein
MFKKKKYLEKIDRKRSGFKKMAGGLYLDRNERAVPYSNKIKKDLEKVIGSLNLNHYPELDQFYSLIAEWKNVKSSNLFLTEGVSGAIKSIIENFTVPGESNIIFPYPSFALYDVYAKMFNLKSKYLKYNNYKLNLKNISSLIDKNTSIIFLANPNLPVEG